MSGFSDHFSKVAAGYSEYRPGYPVQLFRVLADAVRASGRFSESESESDARAGFAATAAGRASNVWDCAAGTGQASVALGEHFSAVLATDASYSQVRQAEPHRNVRYAVAAAEYCPLPDASTSLVTVAQALHWFNVNAFYAEAKRVLKPDGVIAVWCYGLLRVDENRDVEHLVEHFCDVTVGPWWPPERKHIDAGYSDLPFPFERLPTPAIDMTARWTRNQLLGYLRTWSSVSRKRASDGVDPVTVFEPILSNAWGPQDTLQMRWPVSLMAGVR